ncbi:MAG: hypothetical protein ACRBCK_09085 [Alphaproteobacteria bacterium]
MGCITKTQQSINASFDVDGGDGEASIKFSDPSYTRSEAILFNPICQSVHAVLHEGVFFVGRAPDHFVKELKTKNIVGLRANHFSGKDVCLSVPVTFVQH